MHLPVTRVLLLSIGLLIAACHPGPAMESSAKRHGQLTVVEGEGLSAFLAASSRKQGLIAVGARLNPRRDRQWLRIARFDQEGLLDAGFGQGGVMELSSPVEPYGIAVDVQVDDQDRALVCGYWFNYHRYSFAYGPYELVTARAFLLRLTADGHPDPTFGIEGYAYLPPALGGPLTACSAVRAVDAGYVMLAKTVSPFQLTPADHWLPEPAQALLSPLSRMLVRGTYLVRLTETGALDPAFGTAGSATVANDGWLPELAVDGQQRLVVKLHRHMPQTLRLVLELNRFMPNGARDHGYGTGGRVALTPEPGGEDWSWAGRSLQVREDGAALVVGNRWRMRPPEREEAESEGMVWHVDAQGRRDRRVESAALASFSRTSPYQVLALLGEAIAGRHPVLLYAEQPLGFRPRLRLLDSSGFALPGDLVPAGEIALVPLAIDHLHRAMFLSGAFVDLEAKPQGRITSAVQRLPMR